MGGIFNHLMFARYFIFRELMMQCGFSKQPFGSMEQMRTNTILQKRSLKQ